MRVIFVLLLSLSFSIAFAQNTDEELAAQYFSDGEYDKAEILYGKLLKKDPSSVYIYQNYLDCLLKMKALDDAEKMISKQSKKYPNKPVYSVDLGYIYDLQGETKKRDKQFESIIEEMGSSIVEVEQVARSFQKREFVSYAEQALLAGRKKNGMPTAFSEPLMDIYLNHNKPKDLINEALFLLSDDEKNLDLVKSKLIRIVDANTEMDYLQEKTTLYIQKDPNNSSFDQLLMWVFIQQKKFKSAMRQAAALDKRTKQEGRILIDLARICVQSGDYQVATACYQKVIDYGKEGYFYLNAKMGVLETSYLNIKNNPFYTASDLNDLITRYTEFETSFGKTWNTAPSLKQLAEIYVYYAHDLEKGIVLLEELVEIPRLQSRLLGDLKLSLGDAYLMQGNVWDATLLYGQVDKAFKEDALGQEAKFRNAKLSYYQGDFDWAVDQLDVLKTATSQLISNNAIELALLIQDNIGADSSTDALKEFASAQLLLYQNNLEKCLAILDMMPFKFNGHSLEDEIYYTKAQIMFKKRDYKEAEGYLLNVVNQYSDDILADNAVYELGKLYEDIMDEPKKAQEMYEKLIFEYTGSLFVVDARKRLKEVKQKLSDSDSSTP